MISPPHASAGSISLGVGVDIAIDDGDTGRHSPSRNGSGDAISNNNKRKRKRSASLSELKFCNNFAKSGPFSRIRVWVNDRNMVFYDCHCGKRKPLQDLGKIKRHAESHEKNDHRCAICDRTFDHHLQLNAHKKAHKQQDTVSVAAAAAAAGAVVGNLSSDAYATSSSETDLTGVLVNPMLGGAASLQSILSLNHHPHHHQLPTSSSSGVMKQDQYQQQQQQQHQQQHNGVLQSTTATATAVGYPSVFGSALPVLPLNPSVGSVIYAPNSTFPVVQMNFPSQPPS
jgi:hypothetical protein